MVGDVAIVQGGYIIFFAALLTHLETVLEGFCAKRKGEPLPVLMYHPKLLLFQLDG